MCQAIVRTFVHHFHDQQAAEMLRCRRYTAVDVYIIVLYYIIFYYIIIIII